mmetsp:Transcript_14139/g.13669  ORF Transcript_14139/g.13669 Transcript_14139/m.13669 type:complete len:432 (-) Transcript_14139:480-1775(-)
MNRVQIICITLLIVLEIASASWITNMFPFLGPKKESDTSISPKKDHKAVIGKATPPMKKRDLNATIVPIKHSFDDYLLKKVEENVQRLGGMTNLIFIGDSFFYKVSKSKARWSSFEEKNAALNLGSPGDRSEHVLYRFREGNVLSNITSDGPLVVTMIGTSNVNVGDTPASTVAGVQAVVSLLRTHLKNPQILILSLIPRDSGKPVDSVINEVNKLLESTFMTKKEKNVEYLDIAKPFLSTNGTVKFNLFTTDKINPNAAGQDAVFSALEPFTSKLKVLKNVPPPAARQEPIEEGKVPAKDASPLASEGKKEGKEVKVTDGRGSKGKVLEVKKPEVKASEGKGSEGKKLAEGTSSEGLAVKKVVKGEVSDSKKAAPEGKVSEGKKSPEVIPMKIHNEGEKEKNSKSQTNTEVTDKKSPLKDSKAALPNKTA